MGTLFAQPVDLRLELLLHIGKLAVGGVDIYSDVPFPGLEVGLELPSLNVQFVIAQLGSLLGLLVLVVGASALFVGE